MAKDVGEEIVGAWLRLIQECDFVQYNVPTRTGQGEIDVIGLNLSTNVAYICEVATHTRSGLQYTSSENQPNNINKLTRKFRTDVEYARQYLSTFEHRFMLWSPIVKHPTAEETKHNQFQDLVEIRSNLRESHQANIEMVVNEIYVHCIHQLREKAQVETAASEYPVFRLLQIIHSAEKHAARLTKRGIITSQVIAQMEILE